LKGEFFATFRHFFATFRRIFAILRQFFATFRHFVPIWSFGRVRHCSFRTVRGTFIK